MFTHFEGTGGCEWLGGALDAFVRHLNQSLGTSYALTKCLDIVKISGLTPKEPEVLLTDENTGQQMVIERKSVVWPETYIHQHQLGHKFANIIWKRANGSFRDASYQLVLDLREFNSLESKKIRDIANKIGEDISHLTPSTCPSKKQNRSGGLFGSHIRTKRERIIRALSCLTRHGWHWTPMIVKGQRRECHRRLKRKLTPQRKIPKIFEPRQAAIARFLQRQALRG